MKWNRIYHSILFFGIIVLSPFSWAQDNTAKLLEKLDQKVIHYQQYDEAKEKKIRQLKQLLAYSTSKQQRYEIFAQLQGEYATYQLDSALTYARKSWRMAQLLKDDNKINQAKLGVAQILGTSGMYKESIDLLASIPIQKIPQMKGHYYGTYRMVYGYLSEYAASPIEKRKYQSLMKQYRDSSMLYFEPNSRDYHIANTDGLIEKGQYSQVITTIQKLFSASSEADPNHAVLAYLLSEAYRHKKDKVQEQNWLITSAISDLQLAKKENISLRKLALMRYQQGDIDRAYNYTKRSLEDALFCNAKLRTYEISKMLPIINQAYEQKNETNRTQLVAFLLAVSVLSLVLIGAILLLFKQMRKLSQAQKTISQANAQLSLLNQELKATNERLHTTNATLAETSLLKEIYIGRYMDQCSDYIAKLEEYSQKLKVLGTAGKMKELLQMVKSNEYIEAELKAFYTQFDQTFLELFPTFKEDFSKLLADKDVLELKPGELLNTELRIFALIRLGIKDSAKIAVFLRYSVSTIYNYRSQIKNKAIGPRETFEQQVMLIGNSNTKQ